MKVRITDGHIRYRLTPTEVDTLFSDGWITTTGDGTVSFSLHSAENPGPTLILAVDDEKSHFRHELTIPPHMLRTPTPIDPTIHDSPPYLIELDLKPNRP